MNKAGNVPVKGVEEQSRHCEPPGARSSLHLSRREHVDASNAVRDGGAPPYVAESPNSSDSSRPDPNYQRIKRFRDAALRREQNCTGDMALNAHIERLILDTILEGWR